MSKKDESFYYGMKMFKADIPDLRDTDLANLEMCYLSYGDRWRPEIIKALREGKSHYEIVKAKLKAMDAVSKKKESQAGLQGNISYKLRRAAYRVAYLRFRGQGFSRTMSNKKARQTYFPHRMSTDKVINDKFTAAFEVNTRGCSLDKTE